MSLNQNTKAASAYGNLQLVANALNKPDLAEICKQKQIELLASGESDSVRVSTAISHFNEGLNFHRVDEVDDALDSYNQAIELLLPLVKPDPIKSQSVYVQSYWHRAQALLELGRWEEAIDDWKLAIAAAKETGQFREIVPYMESQLLRCQAGNDPVAAAQSIDPLERKVENKAEVLMVIVSVYCLAADKSTQPEEREHWLRKAVSAVKWVKDAGIQESPEPLWNAPMS